MAFLWLSTYIFCFFSLIVQAQGGRVTRISPVSGSVRGATRLTIFGEGFADNQFNYYQPELGNNVTLISVTGTHALACDVIPYYTTRQQIVCNTRPSPFGFGAYNVRVQVDGVLLRSPSSVYCDGECVFKYEDDTTPTVTSVSPRYGLPGSVITIRGKIFTDQYVEAEGTNHNGLSILRVFAGSGLCEPLNQETKKLYGIAFDKYGSSTGYIKCRTSSTSVGSHRVSYIVSQYGRSLMSKDAMLVDSQDKLYVFQAHADVTSVSPPQGSIAGGTIVTIKGQGFEKNNTRVDIGGLPCRVLSVTSDTITCQSGQGFDSLSSTAFYPGNRGILREVWTSTKSSDLSSIATLDSVASDYRSEVLLDASSPAKSSFGESTIFSSRLRGFFVAPSDNNYTFFIQADDKAELHLSTDSQSTKKRKIASCPDAATIWDKYPEQRSAVFSLKAGHAYYIEAYHLQGRGSSHVRIGVKLEKTRYVNSQIGSAVNEKQVIRVLSTEHPETQIINVTNWDSGLTYEMQRISVTPNCTSANKSICGERFQLSYSGHKTTILSIHSTVGDVQTALNNLVSITQQGNVTVTQDKLNGASNYNIMFKFAQPSETQSLESVLVGNGATMTIAQTQKGQNGNWKFRFSLGLRISDYIRVNASESDVKTALQSMLSWQCSYQIPIGRAWYYNGFESKVLGPEFGERVVDERPFCGRASLRNPTYIFRAGQTRNLGGRKLKGIDVWKYRQLCFAYKGSFKPYLNFYVSYTDRSGNGRRAWRKYGFTPLTTIKWHYHCMTIHDNVYSDSYLKSRANEEYGYYVDEIKVTRDLNSDIYVDEVIIWRDSVNVLRQQPAAEPGSHVIKSFDVRQIGSAVWTIYLTPAHCGTDLEMIKIVNAVNDVQNTSADIVAYRPVNQTESMVTVTRVQRATPPVGGTFDLIFKGQRYSGISSSISATELKSKIENNLNIGQINLTRTGACASYNWSIEWATSGGNQPSIEVDGSGLTGNDVSVKVETLDDGGMFLRPIPGEMLRVAEQKPQVSVVVNNIPSSCSTRKCSFVYSSHSTPNLTSIAPNKGQSGTTVQLTGSGFSTNAQDNNVTIGETPCHVTGSTSFTITCTAGQSVGGANKVDVKVKELGFATHVNGHVTFVQEVTVTKVTPNTGSVGGGTTLMITGSGFSLDAWQMTVTLGSSGCRIINSSLSQITCITSKHVASKEDLQVKVRNQTGSLSNAFHFDLSQTPTITTISPQTQSVGGGDELDISGKNLGSRGTVLIGQKPCQITLHYPLFIRCTIPAHAPGIYDVIINVPGKGYASYRGGLPRLEYVLEVTDVSPRYGSVFGGTLVTIRGRGFSTQGNVVTMDDVPCTVVSSRSDQILCRTTDSSNTHFVDNSGIHPEYGLGYAWNPQTVTVNSGDTVKWRWSSPEMTNLQYGVQQTNDSSSEVYNGRGFKSERSSTGWFQHRFNVPGTYYYSSGFVDPYDVINMRGKIVVTGPRPKATNVTVQVGNFTAVHNLTQTVPPLPSTVNCHTGITSDIFQCNPSITTNQHSSFVFRECSTPEVTSISPNIGTSSSLLTIRGRGFGPDLCYSEVTVGSQKCIVLTSTSDVITCRVTTGNTLTAGIPYDVSVRVNNRGNAWLKSDEVASMRFTLLPTVASVSPWSGSLAGGTMLSVTGAGFSQTPGVNFVKIGPTNCTILSASPSEIKCITQSHKESKKHNVSVTVNNKESICVSRVGCAFTFSDSSTPRIDYITPDSIIGAHNVINFYGTDLLAQNSDITIKFGNESCQVITATQYAILCSIGTVVAGSHRISVRIDPKGYALLDIDAAQAIVSLALVSDISPTEGSEFGGTVVTVSGNGFDPRPGQTTVLIGGNECAISKVTNSKIICTTSAHKAGSFEVDLTSGGKHFPGLRFAYRSFLTPRITSIFPIKALSGVTLAITGQGFGSNPSRISVTIGNSTCKAHSVTDGRIMCVLVEHPAGVYDVVVHVKGKGLSGYTTNQPIKMTYDISVASASVQESSLGGGRVISIQGQGFGANTVVKICDNVCIKMDVSARRIRCEVPPYRGNITKDVTCPLAVYGANSVKVSKPGYFTYRVALTSRITSVTPYRGGTGGGVTITITGSGFSTTSGGNKVTIAGIKCAVTSFSSTQIKCITGQRSGFVRSKVRVEVEDKGVSTMDHADFEYIDVWSSRYSWGYKDPPMRGDLVVIQKDQTMLLDVSTPVLAALVIKGKLIFDEKDLVLNAEKIILVDGGVLEVGTESKPFQHKARIVLHGNARSVKLPLFGAKVLAVREGTLDLHGKHVPITWTHLMKTADIGATQLLLKQSVTWKVGDDIILASTSRRPGENEELTITSVSGDGRTIGIKPALKYKHISITQTIAGKVIETRAEVGLLTRNVVVEGSVQRGWTESIRKCPKDFDPDQFATQTCFNGRYNEEESSDQFGSQIMLNAKEMNKGLVTGRISYIEVRHAGQSFQLGRYPIHFHMSGDITGSYVRGCSIHHTFNRAVTIHGVHGLLVEHNVAYHVMGHAYFIEDGIETGNTIQYNLGVYVTSSSSLLNVDVTPGTFWITNPNNTVRHNAAAAGSHFGFWYNMPVHPGGPSYTPSVWPRKTPLGEFRNNTAHSFGRYGLWIFPTYIPLLTPSSSTDSTVPAQFQDFLAYNNLKGFEMNEVGAVQAVNCTMLDNKEAGFEVTIVKAPWSATRGGAIRDSLVVGYSAISGNDPSSCTIGGVVGPHSSRLTLSGVTFVHFNASKCAALRGCSFCRPNQGGWTVKLEKTKFLSSPNKAGFLWQHETVYQDIDGTLTGFAGGSIVATNENLPPEHCTQYPSVSLGTVPGSICDASLKFRRFAWNNPLPTSLLYKDALLTTQYGTSHVPWASMRLTHKDGWMTTVIVGENYNFTFENAQQLSNISYSGRFYEFEQNDYVLITHPMKYNPDIIKTTRKTVNMSSGIPQPQHASTGDWFYSNITKEMTYIVTGNNNGGLVNRDVKLQVIRCFYKNCIKPIPPPPPEKRPLQYLKWSDPESWYGTEEGYGGYNKKLPSDGDDVMIKEGWWMVADTNLPTLRKLIVYGTLELEPTMDFVLNATYIFIAPGANLIIGWPDQPMSGRVVISLHGDWDTPEMVFQDAPSIGAKTMAIFGNLEVHGRNKTVYWTQLYRTADIGTNEIRVKEPVDWEMGDLIVIAPTTYRPHETEVMTIESLSPDGKTIYLLDKLKHKHISMTSTIASNNVTMAAEVGLLTRNVVIEGAEDIGGLQEKQLFGCRVLVSSIKGHHENKERRIRIENVEFRNCGQEGWSDYYDPRYSLAFLDIPSLSSSSYVRGNSFHHGYNTGLGVFGVNGLLIQDNIIHRSLGSSFRITGSRHRVLHNLAVFSVSPATFKGRQESMNMLWHSSFEINRADKITLQDNAAAGSERIGFHIRGEKCFSADPTNPWLRNSAHTCLHGVHIGYNDGYPGCARVANFLSWKNWDYGIFGYPRSRVMMQDCVLADNKAGVLINVYAPPSLSHTTADKFVQLDRTLIIGTSPSFDCSVDTIAPVNVHITSKARGPRTKGGGHIGFVLSTFSSGPGLAPEFPWNMIESYPAINGITRINSITFSSFGTKCGKRSVAIMTNPLSPDAMHPTEISGLSLHSMDQTSLVLLEPPMLGWVNPSDCVDMDCDGHKEVLITDIDGSMTGRAGGTIISKAEYEWNGDPRRGLGDYRIPKAMLTGKDGSRLNASVVAPHHGIVRGTRTKNLCKWNVDWNAYTCRDIDYEMLVIESMDADTEVRRLSPVALSADGYTNLLNGPQDHGWCFGYTCQERISTFYAIVATQRNYTLYFTGTNPEKLRLRLLNSKPNQVLRLSIWYSKPGRLDIYRKGQYVYPTNADLKNSGFTLKGKDTRLPSDQFEPPLTSISGSNYFDNELKMLMVVVRGGNPVDIRTMPIIQVTIGAKPVHVNDFFEKNLITNLAALLNIDRSRIRVVEIVNAAGQSRRRRAILPDDTMKIKLEISNPPPSRIPYKPEEHYDENSTSGPSTSPSTSTIPPPYPDVTSYSELKLLSSKIVEVAQTKKMSNTLKLDVLSIDVVDPEPPRVDPTGGIRATNGTGGPSNGTWRYDQTMTWKEGNKTIPEHDYLIPAKLIVTQSPRDANETVPFGLQPKLLIVDAFNRTVKTLGHGNNSHWLITATIRQGTGQQGSLLGGSNTIPFIDGWANFTNLYITHSADGYIIDFTVTNPTTANITASSKAFEVKERVLYFTLISSPDEANETVSFEKQPAVEVRDAANGQLVMNTGWKGRKWICNVTLENPSKNKGYLNGSTSIEFTSGVARFTNLSIDYAGSGYILSINALTVPRSRYFYRVNTNPFDVKERQLELVIVQQPGNCNDTVTCGFQPIIEIQDLATKRPVGNIGWRGRKWTLLATMVNGTGNSQMNGTTLLTVPKSGRVVYSDLKFNDVATGYQMKYQVNTSPYSASYSRLTAISEQFDVRKRIFYLHVITQPHLANASEAFGIQPVVEVRDVGTRARATPLKTTWMVTVSLFSNPKPGKSVLKGNKTVLVEGERARFTNLMITEYGEGYVLSFESRNGRRALSDRFEVRYVNDYAPEFIPNNTTLTTSVSEGVSIGTPILTVSASDKDKGSQGFVSYSIHSGNVGDSFLIDKHSGNITTRKVLDREVTARYTLIVRASDEAVAEKVRFAEMKVVVIVTDLNDNAPTFKTNPLSANVSETASPGHVVVRVQASDPDAGSNGDIWFSITKGNSDGYFSINENSGDIIVKKVLDMESQPPPILRYSLVVKATDRGAPNSLHNTSSVIIDVTPVNEFAPYFTHSTSRNVTFKENFNGGDSGLELVDVNATDKDYGTQGQVTYSIFSGNDEGRFKINASTGVVKLTKRLDYEHARGYTLVIRATDSGSGGTALHVDFTLRVHVKDVNDNKPVFSSAINVVNIPETLGVGQIAYTVKATDADSSSNGLVSYSIQNGNDGGYFQVNRKSGELRLMKSLDLETIQERDWNRTLRISASDHGIPQLTSSADFECRLTGVNEYSPVFVSKSLSLQLLENINMGTMIDQVSARDEDFGPDGQIRYSIISGNSERKFRVDEASGKLFINAPLDREHTAQFNLKIQAADSPINSANQKRSWTHVDITVEDTNDNRPNFNRKSYYGWIKETAQTGSDVITVHATDPDQGSNGEIRYSISSGNTHGFFKINSTTGTIKTQQSLDLETQKHVDDLIYVLTIDATDKGSPNPLSNSVIVTIEIKSVNEFTPRLLQPSPLYVRIPYTAGIGSLVVDINATDADFGSDGTLKYEIFKGYSDHTFSIDKNTGKITVARQLDYSVLPRYFLEVNISDEPKNGLHRVVVAKVTVRLTTPNDTGGTDLVIRDLCAHLTTPGNIAESAGAPVSCNFSIGILHLGELSEVLAVDDKRVRIDDKTLSRGLFSVIKGDHDWIIQSNLAGHIGQGAFVVHVDGVYSMQVRMEVIGFQSLVLEASLVSPHWILRNYFQRVGRSDGSFEEANLILQMKMSNNAIYDMSYVPTTSYHVISNDVDVVAKVGPRPSNRLRIDRASSYGKFSVYAKMGNLTSPKITLHVINKVVTPVEIIAIDITSLVNKTLLGAASSATGRLQVTMAMSDTTLLTFDNFEEYRDIVQFDCQPGIGASINQKGILTLKQDSPYPEQVTVRRPSMANDYKSMEVFCNTQPPSGGVDIGNLTGPPIMDYDRPISVHINTTGFTLLAYNITIEYDQTTLQFKGLKDKIPYSIQGGRITLLNVVTPVRTDVIDDVSPANPSPSYVTDLIFGRQLQTNRDPFIRVSSNAVLDRTLTLRSKDKTRYCPSLSNQLGDVDSKCGLDFYDAATTMLCSLSLGDDDLCKNSEIKRKMDFNLNGIIEESDASLLLRAAVGQVRFVTSIQINKPDYKNKTNQCALSIITTLVNQDGTPARPTDTQVYFEFSSKKEILRDQLRRTIFTRGDVIQVYDGARGLFGGIVKAESTGDGVFEVKSLESLLELQDLGISMIQVTQQPSNPSPSVVPLFNIPRNPFYEAKIDILLASNARLLATNGHSPQILVNIDQSTLSCRNPNVTKNIEMKFQNDFSSIEGRREQFIKVFLGDLEPWNYNITITTVRLSPGSIKVNSAASGRLSALDSFIAAIWSSLQSGYSLEVDGITFVAVKGLIIDGEEYQKPEIKTSTSTFPVTTVVGVCVAVVILFALVGGVVFFSKRKMRKEHGNAKWMRIKKMSSIHSRSNLSLSEPPDGHEMTFINQAFPERSDDERSIDSTQGNTLSNQIHGTPEIPRMRPSRRVDSAMSRDSVEAWCEEGQESPRLHNKKGRLSPANNGKISPPTDATRSTSPKLKLITKQNSTSRLIGDETDSDGSVPSSPDEAQSPSARNDRKIVPKGNVNVAKILLDHEEGRRSPSKGQKRGMKDPLHRQSSDSRLIELRREKGYDKMPFTRPKLHKKATWAGGPSPRSLSPQLSNSSLPGLPGSIESSPPGSGSLTPQGDWRTVTPSSIYMRNIPLNDDLTIQDEPFTVRLPVNILNTSRKASLGPFTKLGFVETQTDSTLTEVRQTLIKSFDLKGCFFVFEDAQMMDIKPSREDDVIVGDTFSVSVIIKMIVNPAEIRKSFCICDKVAHFQCSTCYRRGYCGRDCQVRDWAQHKKECVQDPVAAV